MVNIKKTFDLKLIKEIGFKSRPDFELFIRKHNIKGKKFNSRQPVIDYINDKYYTKNTIDENKYKMRSTFKKSVFDFELKPVNVYESSDEFAFFRRYKHIINTILKKTVNNTGSLKAFMNASVNSSCQGLETGINPLKKG